MEAEYEVEAERRYVRSLASAQASTLRDHIKVEEMMIRSEEQVISNNVSIIIIDRLFYFNITKILGKITPGFLHSCHE